MLDGRVLGASQVEYKPFGKPGIEASTPARHRSLIASTCQSTRHVEAWHSACATRPRQAAEPPQSPGSLLYVLYVLYLTRQAAEPPLSPGSLLYVLYVLYLTRQAAEPPLSPSSLLYVLYVLYYSVRALKCTICAIQCIFGTCWRCYVYSTQASIPYSTYSTYSKDPGESGCSVACRGFGGLVPAWHSLPAAPPARHRSHTPARRVIRIIRIIRSYGHTAAWHCATCRHLPGIGALPSPRQGIPRKKIQGLPPSILLSPQDCLLQSCCQPRIEGNSTRNSTRATPKKWDMPVSSSELHAGSNQKMVGACFQFRGTSKAQVPLVLSSITFLPGIGASRHLPGIGALPSPRSGFFPGKKCRGCRLSRQL